MIKMSAHQIASLGELQTERFLARCVAGLRAGPVVGVALESEAESTARLRHWIEPLQAFGLTCTGDLERAIHMIIAIQGRAGGVDMPADLAALLRSPHASVENKLEALEQMLLFDVR